MGHMLRILFFATFIALACALLTWQGYILYERIVLAEPGQRESTLVLCGVMLVVVTLQALLIRRAGERVMAGLAHLLKYPLYPLVLLARGVVRMVMGPGVDMTAAGQRTTAVGLVLSLNLLLPLWLASVLEGNSIESGITAIFLQFFLVVDLYLGRALLHYFSNASSAFISLRILRKRPVSLASVLGVGIGTCVLIVVNSIMTGFVNDYREQVRGSLSHIIVHPDWESAVAGPVAVEREVWRHYHAKLAHMPTAHECWQHALALAQQAMREERLPQFIDPSPDAFPSGLVPERPDPVPSVEHRLALLDSSDAIGEQDLSVWLPRHPMLGRATPENIVLSYERPVNRERVRDEIRTALGNQLYVPRMQQTMDFVRDALTDKAAAAGVPARARILDAAPRLHNAAPLGSILGSTQTEDLTFLSAVDPTAELRVSDIGTYTTSAEFRAFVAQDHIWPLVRMLNFTLIFEDPAFTPPRASLSAVANDDHGALRLQYYPGKRMLEFRNYIERSGQVFWNHADQIRFRSGTPGHEMFHDILKPAIQRAWAATDYPELRRVLEQSADDLERFCARIIRKSGENEVALRLRGTPEDERYPGDAASMLYFRETFLSNIGRVRQGLVLNLRKPLLRIRSADTEGSTSLEATLPHLIELLDAVEADIDACARGPLLHVNTSEDAHAVAAGLLTRIWKERVSPYLDQHRADLERVSMELIELLQRYSIPERFSYAPADESLSGSRHVSLAELLRHWDERRAMVEDRQQVYREILPLRTFKLDRESPREYLLRAGNLPPFVKTHPDLKPKAEYLAAAKAYVRTLLLEVFWDTRCAFVDAGKSGVKPPQGLPQEFATWAASIREQIDITLASSVAQADSIPALQQAVDHLRERLRLASQELLDRNGNANSLAELLAPIHQTTAEEWEEYWRVVPDLPGLMVGDMLAQQKDWKIGSPDIKVLVIRRTRASDNNLSAEPQLCRLCGIYRSSMFEDNLKTMYGDFDAWLSIYGAAAADYVVGAKLDSYLPYEGHSLELRDEVEGFLYRHASKVIQSRDSETPQDAASIATAYRLMSPQAMTRVTVWELERAKLLQAVEREKKILTLLLTLIVVLAGIVILIVVYLTVVEKVKDIGTLKALGSSPWDIRSIFMFNAMFIGIFGTLLGAAAGIALSENLSAVEDWIYTVFGVRLFPPDVYFLTYLPSVKGARLWELAANFVAPIVLWSFFCGILPAMLAARKNAVEALHYE